MVAPFASNAEHPNAPKKPMSEEQPITPETPSETPPVVPEPDELVVSEYSKLDTLPPEIVADVHMYIIRGFGPIRLQRVIAKKWGDKCNLLPRAYQTYARYIELHKAELIEAQKFTKSMVDSAQGAQDAVNAVAEATAGGKKLSVKEQLDKLIAFCQERIDFIKKQQTGKQVISSQLENVLVSLVKEQRMIVEKSLEYKQEVDRDIAVEVDEYIMAFMEEFISSCIVIYQELHGEKQLIEFSSKLKEKLPQIRETIRREATQE